jgi:hypothetical protein
MEELWVREGLRALMLPAAAAATAAADHLHDAILAQPRSRSGGRRDNRSSSSSVEAAAGAASPRPLLPTMLLQHTTLRPPTATVTVTVSNMNSDGGVLGRTAWRKMKRMETRSRRKWCESAESIETLPKGQPSTAQTSRRNRPAVFSIRYRHLQSRYQALMQHPSAQARRMQSDFGHRSRGRRETRPESRPSDQAQGPHDVARTAAFVSKLSSGIRHSLYCFHHGPGKGRGDAYHASIPDGGVFNSAIK